MACMLFSYTGLKCVKAALRFGDGHLYFKHTEEHTNEPSSIKYRAFAFGRIIFVAFGLFFFSHNVPQKE